MGLLLRVPLRVDATDVRFGVWVASFFHGIRLTRRK
jgi:hypothetical protein